MRVVMTRAGKSAEFQLAVREVCGNACSWNVLDVFEYERDAGVLGCFECQGFCFIRMHEDYVKVRVLILGIS